LPFASVLLHHKFKQISAKWGKQWGKHYPHFAAFFCIRKNSKNAETLCYKAFRGFRVKSVTGILVPSGPPLVLQQDAKRCKTNGLQRFLFGGYTKKFIKSYSVSDLFSDLLFANANRSLEIAETLVQQAVQLLNILFTGVIKNNFTNF
jgi:hypothetical protein